MTVYFGVEQTPEVKASGVLVIFDLKIPNT